MRWKIVYRDGMELIEGDIHFLQADKKNIKFILFLDDNGNHYGVDIDGFLFFINNKKFDFNIKGDVKSFLQYKSASIDLTTNQNKIKSWNVGIEILNDENEERYILSIKKGGNVYLQASKRNLYSDTTQEKMLLLK